MNKNAKMWAEELPKYKQTTHDLQNGDGYCCLGVACAIYERQTGYVLPKDRRGRYYGGNLQGDYYTVRDWLGLMYTNGSYDAPKDSPLRMNYSLITMNDSGKTFNEISDFILTEPVGLFFE